MGAAEGLRVGAADLSTPAVPPPGGSNLGAAKTAKSAPASGAFGFDGRLAGLPDFGSALMASLTPAASPASAVRAGSSSQPGVARPAIPAPAVSGQPVSAAPEKTGRGPGGPAPAPLSEAANRRLDGPAMAVATPAPGAAEESSGPGQPDKRIDRAARPETSNGASTGAGVAAAEGPSAAWLEGSLAPAAWLQAPPMAQRALAAPGGPKDPLPSAAGPSDSAGATRPSQGPGTAVAAGSQPGKREAKAAAGGGAVSLQNPVSLQNSISLQSAISLEAPASPLVLPSLSGPAAAPAAGPPRGESDAIVAGGSAAIPGTASLPSSRLAAAPAAGGLAPAASPAPVSSRGAHGAGGPGAEVSAPAAAGTALPGGSSSSMPAVRSELFAGDSAGAELAPGEPSPGTHAGTGAGAGQGPIPTGSQVPPEALEMRKTAENGPASVPARSGADSLSAIDSSQNSGANSGADSSLAPAPPALAANPEANAPPRGAARPVSASTPGSAAAHAASPQGALSLAPGGIPHPGAAPGTELPSAPEAGGGAGRASAGELLARMDSGAPAPAPAARLGPHTVEVGIDDPAHGWIEVRAQGAPGQVTASLNAESAEARSALHAHLQAMAQFLAEHDLGVRSVELSAGGGAAGQGGAGSSGHADGGTGGGAGSNAGGNRGGLDQQSGSGSSSPDRRADQGPARATAAAAANGVPPGEPGAAAAGAGDRFWGGASHLISVRA